MVGYFIAARIAVVKANVLLLLKLLLNSSFQRELNIILEFYLIVCDSLLSSSTSSLRASSQAASPAA